MDPTDLRTLRILEALEQDDSPSQRDLAQRLNISLGLTNSFLKRLAQKGYFKISTIPRKRVKYMLTPAGALAKARLTCEYIQFSYRFYREARQKLQNLFRKMESQGVRRIAFYGASDFAEIAYLSLQETAIELAMIVDEAHINERFMDRTIHAPDQLKPLAIDQILVTAVDGREEIVRKIRQTGMPDRKVATIS
jgi:DNA-binding MarR family transcriptional regulator